MTDGKDPTPLGYLTLREAFQKFREAKHGVNVDEHPPHGSAKWQKWYGPYSKALDEDLDRFETALKQGEIEVIVTFPRDGRDCRITPHEIQTAFWPGKMALSDTIADLASGPLGKYAGRTPHVSSTAFAAWIVGLKLRHAREAGLAAPKKTVAPALAAAEQAIRTLFAKGIPATLRAPERNEKIQRWCKSNELPKPSARTISTALKNVETPRE